MAYQSEAALEQQFIDQLNKQGYTSVSIPDYDALVENFKTQFETFNSAKLDRPLTDKEWERVMNIISENLFSRAQRSFETSSCWSVRTGRRCTSLSSMPTTQRTFFR